MNPQTRMLKSKEVFRHLKKRASKIHFANPSLSSHEEIRARLLGEQSSEDGENVILCVHQTHSYTHNHACKHNGTFTHVYISTHMHAHNYKPTHRHTYTHTHKHTHTHSYDKLCACICVPIDFLNLF